LHMGVSDRKIGPPLSFPARQILLLLYHIKPHLSIGKINKNPRIFQSSNSMHRSSGSSL
jgi:hypothetical protein